MATTTHRVLLTSVCRPFGGPGEGDSVGAELFHAQVTRAQGAFSHRQVIRVWALDYLAHNIDAPAVTLHYPSKREFVAELKRGGYTHVGINFVVATFHKVQEMVPLIRRHAPQAKIVLGGYGTVLPDAVLCSWSDAICREEGIAFMRRELGEPPRDQIDHPHAPIPAIRVLGRQQTSVVGHVTAGLGCTNGCDFCCTSHFFDQKYVPFSSTGRDIYEALMETRAHADDDGEKMESFIIIDEDFFMHRRRARDFLDCVREGGEPLSLMGFGSVRGLSRFTGREIGEMGFDLIWTAFEGKNSGYRKQMGRPLPELYRDLKSVGCSQLTSMIIGFPYQTEETIREEFEELMALEPTLMQCLIYFAFPTTPFHEQVVAEGRYRELYRDAPDLRRWDGFSMHFEHPNFEDPERVEVLQHELYREDFRRLGPSLMRLMRNWLTGYENLRDDPNPLLAARAERLRESVRGAAPTLGAAILLGPSKEARERARSLREDIIRLTGSLRPMERLMEAATPALFLMSQAAGRLRLFEQPGLLRTEHRTKQAAASLHTGRVFRLQGAPAHSAAVALVEDLRNAVVARFQERWGNRRPVPGLDRVNAPEQSPARSLPIVA